MGILSHVVSTDSEVGVVSLHPDGDGMPGSPYSLHTTLPGWGMFTAVHQDKSSSFQLGLLWHLREGTGEPHYKLVRVEGWVPYMTSVVLSKET
jgi:hypothetical protein